MLPQLFAVPFAYIGHHQHYGLAGLLVNAMQLTHSIRLETRFYLSQKQKPLRPYSQATAWSIAQMCPPSPPIRFTSPTGRAFS
jgi:hypothetical protein